LNKGNYEFVKIHPTEALFLLYFFKHFSYFRATFVPRSVLIGYNYTILHFHHLGDQNNTTPVRKKSFSFSDIRKVILPMHQSHSHWVQSPAVKKPEAKFQEIQQQKMTPLANARSFLHRHSHNMGHNMVGECTIPAYSTDKAIPFTYPHACVTSCSVFSSLERMELPNCSIVKNFCLRSSSND
jgi:hypothetical protein